MKHISSILQTLNKSNKVFIQPHNIPDPDAIASSFGLCELLRLQGVESKIIYINYIEKTNSKTMIDLFDIKMNLKSEDYISDPDDYIILIDSQIGNSNITNIKGKNVIVIDHHKDVGSDYPYLYKYIREDIGACSTIIASYYKELNLEPSVNVATALLYGIMNDTNNLTRKSSMEDLEIFYWLYGIANLSKIKSLRMNEIGREDLYAYAKALEDIEIYKNIGFVHIEDCNDSLLGTISDMVYTIEGVSIVVSYARRKDGIKFSIRSGESFIVADELVKHIISDKGVGGGHKEMAGGFIKEEFVDFYDHKELDTYVRYKAIAYVEEQNEKNRCFLKE